MFKLNVVAIVALATLLAVQTVRLHWLQNRTESNSVLDARTQPFEVKPGEALLEAVEDAEGVGHPHFDAEENFSDQPAGIDGDGARQVLSSSPGALHPNPNRRSAEAVSSSSTAQPEPASHKKNARARRKQAGELVRKAKALGRAGDFELAVEALIRSLELDPRNREAYSWLANVYGLMGDREKEAQVYQDWIDALPDSPYPHLRRARLSERAGLDGDAADELMRFQELADMNVRSFESVARTYRNLGLRDEELQVLAQWVESAPDSAPARLSLARHYRETGQWELAIEEYQAVTALDPENAQAFADMATLFSAAGQHQDATESLLTAQELRPADLYLEARIADSYSRENELETAIQYYAGVVDARPDSPLGNRAQRAINRLERRLQQQRAAAGPGK